MDLLGLYVHKNIKPSHIFIWGDKIRDRANGNDKNAEALFDFTLFHEQGHALMDVELYGEKPSKLFSYDKDYIYFFIEEAYANAFALTTTMNSLAGKQQEFIKSFVSNQIDGYRKGWDWYEEGCFNFSQWMIIKTDNHFKNKIQVLVDFWNNKDFSILSR